MRGPRKRLDQIFPARKVTSNVSLPNFKKEFSPGIDKENIYVGSVDPNAASRRGGNVCFGESRNVSTENNRLPVFPKCEGSYGRNYTTDSWLNRCHSRVPKFVPPRPVDSELNEDNLNGENFNRRRSAGVSKFVPPRPVGPKLEVDVFGKFSSRNPAGSPIGSRDDASSEKFADKRKHIDDENFREPKKQRVDDDSEEDFVASTPPLDVTNENTRAEKPGIFSQKMTVSQRSFWIDDKEICETFFDIDEEQMGMGETENGSGDLRLPEILEKTCSACAVEKLQGECENAGNNATFGTSEAVICLSVPGSPEDNFNQTRRENDLGSHLRSCVVRDGLCWIANPKNGDSLVDQLSGIPKSEDNGSTVSPGAAFWHDSVESFDGILVSNVGRQVSEKVNLGRQNSAGVTRGNEIMRADARLHSQVVQVKEGDEVAMQQCTVEEDNNVESLLSIDGDTRAASRNAAGMCCDLPECRLESASACAKKFESEEGNQNTNVVKSKAQYKVELRKWLPPDMCAFFAKKGLTRLYQWQVECLQIDGVLDGRSLVYSASTSAGKSLVAELLMLRRVLSTGKKAMLVLPYVSLCCEKATHLQALLQPLGKRVRGFYGTQGGSSLPEDTSVAVCTIEKANSLMNKLLEQGRVSELCIVVIDELHMVGDEDRGYLLELLLTKIRYIKGCEEIIPSSKTQTRTTSSPECTVLQIVGMSATMANVFEVAKWLQAALYQTEFRPVPLEEFLKVGNTIFDKRMEIVRMIRESADLMGKDPDHVVELCHEVVSEGHSVLVFCSSRRGCETSARHIARHLPPFTVIRKTTVGPVDGAAAIEELRRCSAGLDPVLEDTLSAGVAYHHAGLTAEEREVVETCFKSGVVRVLVATSTLAAGVNLPARRVIFRQPKIGRDFVDATRYRQMAGRAGRAGIDSKGESILICKPEEAKRIMEMMKQECKALQSCLAGDKNGMTHALLEVVAGGIVQSSADVERYVRCTLLSATHVFEEVVKAAQDSLRWLCYKRFLEWNASAEIYLSTPLGRAAFSSSLSPEDSLIVFEDLAKAREGFVLASDLHLIYEVTPTYFDLEPDWGLFLQRYMDLSPIDQSVGNRVGVMEAFLLRMAHGAPILQHCSAGRSRGGKAAKGKLSPLAQKSRWKSPGGAQLSVDQLLRICKRFYAALMLSYLVQEVPLLEICKLFKVQKGALQGLQNSAGKFAGMVSAFCERLGWSDIKSLVDGFRKRVALGVKSEIVDLTEIPFVKSARARALFEAGLKSVQAVAEATIDELFNALFSNTSRKSQDQSCNEQQRLQVVIARKIKNAARQIALDRAEQSRAAAFSACQALGVQVDAGLALPSFAPFAPIDEEEANESR